MEIQKLVGDELLVCALQSFPIEKPFQLQQQLTEILYEMSQNKQYQELFKGYHFNTQGTEIYSREVSDGIYFLTQAEIWHVDSLWPKASYRLTEAIKIRFEKFIKPTLNETQIELLERLSNECKSRALTA